MSYDYYMPIIERKNDTIEKCVSALERLEYSYRLLLAQKPVRDVSETLAEVESAVKAGKNECA